MQPLVFSAEQISSTLAQVWWPLLRTSGFIAVAPVMGSSSVPVRARIALSVCIALLLAPAVRVPAGLTIFSGAGAVAAVHQLLVGLAIGLVVQLAFDALTLAGQTISMTMGLGYATLIDPQHGANTTVLGQLFTIFAVLVYLALNGHLTLLGALTHSFISMPVGEEGLDANFFGSVAMWGAQLFEAGLLIALPATIALIIVNLAIGVITRAAPQLNLFGIGFPITMIAGYFVLIVGLDGVMSGINALLVSALRAAADLVTPMAATGH